MAKTKKPRSIGVDITPEAFEAVEEARKKHEMSRAAYHRMALKRQLAADGFDVVVQC